MKEPIIIIGAGAAGLSLAYHLRSLNQEVVILEKSDKIASTWSSMPDHLRLISSWRCNSLLLENKNKYARDYRMSANDYAQYLKDFSNTNKIQVKTNTHVLKIVKNDHSFDIITSNETIKASKVIIATGFYSNPIIPEPFNHSNGNIPFIHFSTFKNVDELKFEKILVVGKRLSAGQIIEELIKKNISVEVSARSKIDFMPPAFIFSFFLKYLYEIEKFILIFFPNLRKDPNVPMEGGIVKDYFKKGIIPIRPMVTKVKPGGILTFQDGSTGKYDAVILATGFSAAFRLIAGIPAFKPEMLKENFIHPEIDNLFFLGLDQQYNFRSRFLRGMREDAKELAKIITKKV